MEEKKKKKAKAITSKAKKKMAVARARIEQGRGRITINKKNIECIMPEHLKEFIKEPLNLAGETAKNVNIEVSAMGGGFMGQAVAARSAIAKALLNYSKDEKLKQKFLEYDRMLLVDDPRRVESKKPLGKKARKKKQKSKR